MHAVKFAVAAAALAAPPPPPPRGEGSIAAAARRRQATACSSRPPPRPFAWVNQTSNGVRREQLWVPAGGCFTDSETREHAACMQ
jgi:hypothetical protein